MTFTLRIKIYLVFFLLCSRNLLAQDSVIDTAIKARESIVTVKALKTDFYQSPKASAALDPATGRVILAHKLLSSHALRTGTGVIVSSSGLIVTNLHTIINANKLSVILHDQTSAGAQILHLLPQHDLALLKINPPFGLQPVAFADSDTVKLGDAVTNIGNSELLKETISGGIVTGLGTGYHKVEESRQTVELIEVNINLYSGDSGGPLLDKQGRLIGMIVAKLRNKDKASFAIPSNKIKILYSDFIQ